MTRFRPEFIPDEFGQRGWKLVVHKELHAGSRAGGGDPQYGYAAEAIGGPGYWQREPQVNYRGGL